MFIVKLPMPLLEDPEFMAALHAELSQRGSSTTPNRIGLTYHRPRYETMDCDAVVDLIMRIIKQLSGDPKLYPECHIENDQIKNGQAAKFTFKPGGNVWIPQPTKQRRRERHQDHLQASLN